ncbi:hypothetical protein BC830DRAFT_870741 [Chytriomyces sp. MP71]|nr:hypothetical protein BC830DRAFT_870741 [Chytriomyces sp. MP71]
MKVELDCSVRSFLANLYAISCYDSGRVHLGNLDITLIAWPALLPLTIASSVLLVWL